MKSAARRVWALSWLILLIVSCLLQQIEAIAWLSLGMSGATMNNLRPHKCRTLSGLTKRQVKLCRKNVEHMNAVQAGAFKSVIECQFQFQNRRWNCSMLDPNAAFGNVFKLGTREAAFVNAIAAAGVAHEVTADCSRGKLDKCGCDQTHGGNAHQRKPGFRWAGCSDNVAYGSAFSRAFVDAHEHRRKQPLSRMLMNIHNNEAGRQAVQSHIRTKCKCHGVSGSCELKTCWRAMASFREIGDILKEKFDGATEVKPTNSSYGTSLRPVSRYLKPHTISDLVYLDNSPDYCVHSSSLGTLGTNRRVCNASSPGIDGCELLCCHRGYETVVEVANAMCDCKFHWCCKVKCKKCKEKKYTNYCL